MSVFFADSSALVKRYVPEIGSAWVASWIEPVEGNVIIISELAFVEQVAVLARRRRRSSIMG